VNPTPPSPPRFIALDLGARRIGVAMADPMTRIPLPLTVIERITDQQAVEAVAALIDQFEVDVCVVGLPLNMDGREGKPAQRARSFAGRLKSIRPALECRFWDERMTTLAADEALMARGIPNGRRRGLRDQIAATIILEEYLRHQPGP